MRRCELRRPPEVANQLQRLFRPLRGQGRSPCWCRRNCIMSIRESYRRRPSSSTSVSTKSRFGMKVSTSRLDPKRLTYCDSDSVNLSARFRVVRQSAASLPGLAESDVTHEPRHQAAGRGRSLQFLPAALVVLGPPPGGGTYWPRLATGAMAGLTGAPAAQRRPSRLGSPGSRRGPERGRALRALPVAGPSSSPRSSPRGWSGCWSAGR
jgi:hypothetical protein